MDLLPKTKSDFTSKDYWEQFFQKRGRKAFEWYGEYNELCGILHKYMKAAEKILVIGCGNSKLSGELYDIGYHGITNVDISDTVIAQMNKQNEKRSEMKFLKMDVTKLEFDAGCYNVVFDKGTLDALMPDSDPTTLETVDAMFGEIDRMLRLGGRYMCVTLAQPHILQHMLHHFHNLGWMLRVCRVPDKESEDTSQFYMPVFVIVATKFKRMPNMKPLTEVCNFDDSIERVDGVEGLEKAVQGLQQYGLVRQQLNTKKELDENISLDLYSSGNSVPRYTLHIVNNPKRCKDKFAIFIVPEGRESEWLFTSPEGQLSVCESACHQRLVIVTLHREHEYPGGLDSIKAELSAKVLELAPPNINNKQVPFLSVGDDINTRGIRHRGNSQLSGDYVIEDVETCGESGGSAVALRRLIFLDNPSVIQSEVNLVRGSGKHKGEKVPDPSSLTLEYYKNVVAGLSLIHHLTTYLESKLDVLLIGLGGGSLGKYLHKHFTNCCVEAVELDPEMVKVATDWFSFTQDARCHVTVADGLQHVDVLAKQGVKKQLVILDVDSKDVSVGLTCPPRAFVTPQFLTTVESILDPKGVLALNLVCRNKTLKDEVIADIKSVFPHVYLLPNTDTVNETLFALPSTRSNVPDFSGKRPAEVTSHMTLIQDIVRGHNRKHKARTRDSALQLTRCLDELKLL